MKKLIRLTSLSGLIVLIPIVLDRDNQKSVMFEIERYGISSWEMFLAQFLTLILFSGLLGWVFSKIKALD